MVIKPELAQQIVDSVRTIVDKNINFIDRKGIIIASTDLNRVGDFHEAGYQAVRLAEVRSVADDETFRGSRKGVNYPIYYENRVVAVIGISGEPEEVSRYGFLVSKITEVFIKEQALEMAEMQRDLRINRLISHLILEGGEGVEGMAHTLGLSTDQSYCVMLLYIDKRCHEQNRPMVEKEVTAMLQQQGMNMYSYIYPNAVVLLINEQQNLLWQQQVSVMFQQQFDNLLHIGISEPESLYMIQDAYRFARTAAEYAVRNHLFQAYASEMHLETLLASMDTKMQRKFAERHLGCLTEEEQKLLVVYYDTDMSLEQTAKKMYVHKNTVQYKLNIIAGKLGVNPRKFRHAVELYIALRFKNVLDDN
ncbi:MAG: CdaR family transcriptional regulator [Coprococcus sp.]